MDGGEKGIAWAGRDTVAGGRSRSCQRAGQVGPKWSCEVWLTALVGGRAGGGKLLDGGW